MTMRRLELPQAPPAVGELKRQSNPAPIMSEERHSNLISARQGESNFQSPPELIGFDKTSSQRIGTLLEECIDSLESAERYGDALLIARLHWKIEPENLNGLYSEALMLFKLRSYDEARRVLENAPKIIWNHAQFHHNMACIEVGLGNLPAGLEHATAAARLNKNALREMLKDPDLKPIWVPLKQNTKDIR